MCGLIHIRRLIRNGTVYMSTIRHKGLAIPSPYKIFVRHHEIKYFAILFNFSTTLRFPSRVHYIHWYYHNTSCTDCSWHVRRYCWLISSFGKYYIFGRIFTSSMHINKLITNLWINHNIILTLVVTDNSVKIC